MKITDGALTVEITMKVWNDSFLGYGPDFSYDFFDAGALPVADDLQTYIVNDVVYLIDLASEWETESEDNYLFVDVI